MLPCWLSSRFGWGQDGGDAATRNFSTSTLHELAMAINLGLTIYELGVGSAVLLGLSESNTDV